MVQQLKKGDFVGLVDLSIYGPREVPIPKRWYLLRTHPNKEAKVMRACRQRNISAYLPLITTSKTVTLRSRLGYQHEVKRNVTSPLFPGVILIPDYQRDGDRVLQIDGVAGFMRFGDWTAWLKPSMVADIRNIEAICNTPPSKRERMYEVGQLVRVLSGPFAYFTGRIERLDSRGRLSVLVDVFKRMTPVELEEGQVEAD